jgi:carboxyl-terminal processing protease
MIAGVTLKGMLTRFARAVLATIALSSIAAASPASDLFNQAAHYLETQYFGPSTVDIPRLIERYRAELEKTCADQVQTCGFDRAEPLIAKMLEDMDDAHAYYMTAAQVTEEIQRQSGNAQSLTLRIGVTHRGFMGADGQSLSPDRMITSVLPDSPAGRAGLQEGDRWVGFDDQRFERPDDWQKFGERIRAGETVKMLLVRGPERTQLEVSLRGELINTVNLPSLQVRPDGIGVLRITDFNVVGVGQRVHDLVREAQTRGVSGIILDMRGNGGGLGSERAIAGGAFIENPEPMRRVPRYDAQTRTVEEVFQNGVFVQRGLNGFSFGSQSVQNPVLWRGPVVVLVDGGCASACEYLAAYFQRAKRGPVLGEPTVGIGNTNTQRFTLLNGGAAAVPTLRAFWTDGTSLPTRITPDVLIENAALVWFNTGQNVLMDRALELLGANK